MALDWEKLRLFASVADAGSFTEAARRLHVSQPALSRQISALEEQLGAKLFHRHARGLALTHEGEQLCEAAREVSDRIERTQMAIEASRERPTGEIRLTTTVSFGSTWLARQMADFLERYPDIRVQMVLTDSDVDLARREADVAIRFHPPRQSELVARTLTTIRYRVCAAPAYLERWGEPLNCEELDGHRLITYGPNTPETLKDVNWLLEAGAPAHPRSPVLAIDNLYGILQAVETGVGIAALPSYLIQFSGRVRTILPRAQGPQFKAFFVYPPELRRSVRVGVLRDYLAQRMTLEALEQPPRA